MSPSSEGWLYIVLVIDALLLVCAGGESSVWIQEASHCVLSLLVGIVILVLGVRNHIQAPPLDGVNDTI